MRSSLLAAYVVVATLGAPTACGPRGADLLWYAPADACLRHDQCVASALCVEGVCAPREGDGPIGFVPGSEALDRIPGGSCRWDDQCGPGRCTEGRCMDPGAGEGVGLPRSAFLYWDLSCLEHADCGTWMCASGYCAEPGRIGPFAEAPPNTDVGGTGTPCLADLDCGAGLDCRYPGYCHEGIADTPFFVSEIPFDRSAATYPDGSCNVDADCPGRPCVDGWCIAPEYAGFAPPRRGDLNYYDGSCTADADCGPWVCVQSWCRDPARVGADHGVPGDTSQAARARAAGVWQSDAAELAEWVEIDTQAHGLGVAEVSTSADVGDKWGLGYGYGASALSTLGSGAGYGTALGSLSGSGFGAGGYGLGGIGTIGGLGTGGTYCSSNADCPTGDACVYPGECRAGAGSEPFTTANIAFSATPGDACSTDDDCGPMYCRSSVCTPVEDVEASMPPRSDIYWNDGSCDSPDDCGSWVCAGLWCRPR